MQVSVRIVVTRDFSQKGALQSKRCVRLKATHLLPCPRVAKDIRLLSSAKLKAVNERQIPLQLSNLTPTDCREIGLKSEKATLLTDARISLHFTL